MSYVEKGGLPVIFAKHPVILDVLLGSMGMTIILNSSENENAIYRLLRVGSVWPSMTIQFKLSTMKSTSITEWDVVRSRQNMNLRNNCFHPSLLVLFSFITRWLRSTSLQHCSSEEKWQVWCPLFSRGNASCSMTDINGRNRDIRYRTYHVPARWSLRKAPYLRMATSFVVKGPPVVVLLDKE